MDHELITIPIRIRNKRICDLVWPCNLDDPMLLFKTNDGYEYIHLNEIRDAVEAKYIKETIKNRKD